MCNDPGNLISASEMLPLFTSAAFPTPTQRPPPLPAPKPKKRRENTEKAKSLNQPDLQTSILGLIRHFWPLDQA